MQHRNPPAAHLHRADPVRGVQRQQPHVIEFVEPEYELRELDEAEQQARHHHVQLRPLRLLFKHCGVGVGLAVWQCVVWLLSMHEDQCAAPG